MNEKIFRKKSLEKVKSPENLDEFIQVSNPGIWLILVSVIALLIGTCIWGFFGHIDSIIATNVHVENSTKFCTITENEITDVRTGMSVKFNGEVAVISEIEKDGLDYRCILKTDEAVEEGVYEGKIVIMSIRPISFILN